MQNTGVASDAEAENSNDNDLDDDDTDTAVEHDEKHTIFASEAAVVSSNPATAMSGDGPNAESLSDITFLTNLPYDPLSPTWGQRAQSLQTTDDNTGELDEKHQMFTSGAVVEKERKIPDDALSNSTIPDDASAGDGCTTLDDCRAGDGCTPCRSFDAEHEHDGSSEQGSDSMSESGTSIEPSGDTTGDVASVGVSTAHN